jgi:phage shock protein C
MGKRLMRSSTDKQLAGVSAGLGNYFNIDPTIVRLIFIVATILGGPGLLVYIILWAVMPEDKGMTAMPDEKAKNDDMTA